MKSKKSVKILTILVFLIPAMVIGTCNYRANTSQSAQVLENPQPGDVLVIRDLLTPGAMAFKVDKNVPDSLCLLVPDYSFFDYNSSKHRSVIREKKSGAYLGGRFCLNDKEFADLTEHRILGTELKGKQSVKLLDALPGGER